METYTHPKVEFQILCDSGIPRTAWIDPSSKTQEPSLVFSKWMLEIMWTPPEFTYQHLNQTTKTHLPTIAIKGEYDDGDRGLWCWPTSQIV